MNNSISEFINQMNAYEGEAIVLKIGGEPFAEDSGFLDSLAIQLRTLQKFSAHIVLVHGAGPQIKEALRQKNIQRTRHPCGRWMTGPSELPVIQQTMNALNHQIARALMQQGCGLFSVAAGECCLMKAKPLDNNPEDLTGLPDGIFLREVHKILQRGQILVTHSLGLSAQGALLNVNADDCAQAFAVGLRAKRLVLATDINGVLDAQGKTISELTPEMAERLKKDGIIVKGMAVKVDSAIEALHKGVDGVAIIKASGENAILTELGTQAGKGTLIRPKKLQGKAEPQGCSLDLN